MSESTELLEAKPRGMIFVDFWNYELTMKELEPGFLTDWFKLPSIVIQEISLLLGETVQYGRCFIFGSYDPSSPGDARLRSWATTVLSKVPGVAVSFVPRQKRRRGPHCTGAAHHEITECPFCHASMLGTQEKGVDTQIATEMLDMAYSNCCDVIALVSADRDFIPAVQKLLARNIKVIHAFFPNHGHELAATSWASFDLFKAREQFRR
ncbi:NYN domain-containing protein [Desulfovibrio sp. ZJ200]|uniref:NYN domain-containing protein n=1 Tax=Desulfovibrio sp. ZJ200 TaxID=2709792 RepID=UPI0013EB0F7F|nr:NYN domain-containing protein [Desulfovibrio sp. ZJ200]